MKCHLCGSESFGTVFWTFEPDVYEKCVGLGKIERAWKRCNSCGLYHQFRDYPLKVLEAIYDHEYRSTSFRGETIEEAFQRIMAIPDSENKYRVGWLLRHVPSPKTVMDIGSGIGVFPAEIKLRFPEAVVYATDKNDESERILKYLGFSADGIGKYDLVTLVHVLEHIEDLKGFLYSLKTKITEDGHLFIEVPDAAAFRTHRKDHDDFNSCHVYSFDMGVLYYLLTTCGYDVIHAHRITYKDRNLKRLLVVAGKHI